MKFAWRHTHEHFHVLRTIREKKLVRMNFERDASGPDCGAYQVIQAAEQDETVIVQIVSAQREELELEIASLETEAEQVADEARELAGEVPL